MARSGTDEARQPRLAVFLLGGNPSDWDCCLTEIRKAGVKVQARSIERLEHLLDRLVPGECSMLLVSPNSPRQLPAGIPEILGDSTLNLPVVVVGEDGGEEAVGPYLQAGIWDYVSQDSLWRLAVLARRALEHYALRQRLQEVEDLWAEAAHDVSNLLAAVMGQSELILMRVKADEELRRSVEGILKTGEAAASWMKQCVTDRRGSPARPGGDLNQGIAGIESILGVLAGSRIQLRLSLWPEPLPVTADPPQMARMIINLALNARDAMPEGGRLTVKTEAAAAGEIPADCAPGPWAKITVADSGVGIGVEQQSRIFDRSYSTKDQHQGLGLATVRRLVERCGGFVTLKSAARAGTVVSIYLPCAPQLSEETAATPRRQVFSDRSKKILVVDDDPPLREVLTRTLSIAGYCVLEARTAQEALQIQSRQPGSIDLVLTDVRMSSMSGWKLAETLRERDPKMKVIYISGYSDHHANDSSQGADFLMKPFKPTVLLERVQASLAEV
jgi:two-component system cell cycle sensor histidine kinase/response regulator CckA